jgi:hypothetical protein
MPDREGRRPAIPYAVTVCVLTALFPKTAYRLRWPTRLGPRGLAAYILFNTAVQFAARAWLLPALRRQHARLEHLKADMRKELGREPTQDELTARFTRRGSAAAA